MNAHQVSVDQQELSILREFYSNWRQFHKLANAQDRNDKEVRMAAQLMLEAANAVELSRQPIFEMANG